VSHVTLRGIECSGMESWPTGQPKAPNVAAVEELLKQALPGRTEACRDYANFSSEEWQVILELGNDSIDGSRGALLGRVVAAPRSVGREVAETVLQLIHSVAIRSTVSHRCRHEEELGSAVELICDYLDLILVPIVLRQLPLRDEALHCTCELCSQATQGVRRLQEDSVLPVLMQLGITDFLGRFLEEAIHAGPSAAAAGFLSQELQRPWQSSGPTRGSRSAACTPFQKVCLRLWRQHSSKTAAACLRLSSQCTSFETSQGIMWRSWREVRAPWGNARMNSGPSSRSMHGHRILQLRPLHQEGFRRALLQQRVTRASTRGIRRKATSSPRARR